MLQMIQIPSHSGDIRQTTFTALILNLLVLMIEGLLSWILTFGSKNVSESLKPHRRKCFGTHIKRILSELGTYSYVTALIL